jgi:hypothetical protein
MTTGWVHPRRPGVHLGSTFNWSTDRHCAGGFSQSSQPERPQKLCRRSCAMPAQGGTIPELWGGSTLRNAHSTISPKICDVPHIARRPKTRHFRVPRAAAASGAAAPARPASRRSRRGTWPPPGPARRLPQSGPRPAGLGNNLKKSFHRLSCGSKSVGRI